MSATSSASCALSTQTSCQPRSRTASASLCSTPKAPGSSSARLPTMATMGMRSAGVTVSASIAYIQPTPLEPQNTRAPQALACLTISNCECSPSAMMYSQSISPLETSLAMYCITVSRSEEHTSELQSRLHLVCRLLLETKKPRHVETAYERLATEDMKNSK